MPSGSLSIGVKERIDIPKQESFRVLKWEKRIDDVYSIFGSGEVRRIHGEGTHWHYHQEVELVAFTEGSGLWFVGDHIKNFVKGSVVLLGGNLPHYWHVPESSAGVAVQYHFPPSHPVWGFSESRELANQMNEIDKGIAFSGRSSVELIEILQRMTRSTGLERLGLFFELIATANRAPESEKVVLSSRTFWLDKDSDQQNVMRIAMHYVLTHYKEEIRLEDLLSVTRMSRATFSRYFKKHTGKSLYKVIQEIRIEAACKDLTETHKPVTEIAMDCGFSQISFFNRTFQRIVKCSPSVFRKRHFR